MKHPATFRLETMRIEDFDEVTALWQASEGVGLNESDTRASLGIFLARNSGLSFVAREANGQIVGAVLCGHDGRRGCLYHLAVLRSERRRGIGKALVEACRAGLHALGIHRMNIFVYADNAAGKVFWEKLGWRVRGELCLMQRETV